MLVALVDQRKAIGEHPRLGSLEVLQLLVIADELESLLLRIVPLQEHRKSALLKLCKTSPSNPGDCPAVAEVVEGVEKIGFVHLLGRASQRIPELQNFAIPVQGIEQLRQELAVRRCRGLQQLHQAMLASCGCCGGHATALPRIRLMSTVFIGLLIP